MQIVPQQSRVVVEPIEEADGQIVIPNSKTEDGDTQVFKRMRVIAIGTGRVLDSGIKIEIPLKEGDEVVIDGRYAAQLQPRTWYENRELYVVDYAGVLAKVERQAGESVTFAPSPKILRAIAAPHIKIA